MSLRERLRNDLSDSEFRHAYADEQLNLSVATQIKVIREQLKLSQKELADKLDTKQAGVSRLESANYNKWSVRLLKRLAEAFDLRLRISFEEFGTLWREVDDFSREGLQRHSFKDDPEFLSASQPCNVIVSSQSGNNSASMNLAMEGQRNHLADHDITCIDESPLWGKSGMRKTAQSEIANSAGNNSSMQGAAWIS